MNPIEQYEQEHGKEAAKLYVFTTIQLQMIKGYLLLATEELSDEEFEDLTTKLSKLNSVQTAMFVKGLKLTQEEVALAMESASLHSHELFEGETIQ